MDQAIQKLTNMITKKGLVPLHNNIYEADYTVNFNQDINLNQDMN